MKQWLIILVSLWLTATIQNAGERHEYAIHPQTPTAVFTPDNGTTPHAEEIPLLATATASGPSQLCGASHDTNKGGRQTEHASTASARLIELTTTTRHRGSVANRDGIYTINTHSSERYIYFLRRIII